MLESYTYNDVTVYRMGRNIGRVVPYSVHAFLIGDTLIDSGTAYAQKEFLEALAGRTVSRIINTHFHEDHTGNNSAIQKKYSAGILAHRDSLLYIEHPDKFELKPYQKFVWKRPDPSQPQEIGSTVNISEYRFDVIHTRGHSEGHICLYEPSKKWLFTGDLFCGIRNIYLRRDEDYKTILESLERLSELEIGAIFCSLKGVINNGKDALQQKINFMKDMISNTHRLHDSGMTISQISRKLLGREDAMYYITGGHFSKGYLVKNILEG